MLTLLAVALWLTAVLLVGVLLDIEAEYMRAAW